ncbi:hypothetical protein C900_02205 [Fulvivirga imtechensis AK7]|uniref:DUF3822 domain-containing protein n=1 Tax=Fulvivirga imtechensis AK7 TaxID=1237149 RepID=L8JSL0_9BACT|nr:DUF3822 family protein [Fulvivirga imtechensis]ELR71830.1 hypothetical protein C900_02205 [Fulvivirga imtechensis AK7]
MDTATLGYKLVKKIKDEKFDVDKLHQYNLMIQLGIRDLQIAIVDSTNNRCLLLEDYILASVKSHQALRELLITLFEEHHLLMAGFWKSVRISIKNNKFCLIPSALFVKEALVDYLRLNSTYDPAREDIYYYKHIKSDAVCVFAVNRDISEWLKQLYPNAEVGFIHQSSALIEGVINFEKTNKKNTMYLYIDRFRLHIITLKNDKLEYYNQFAIKQFNDYIRYIMLVMKGLHKNQKTSDVVLWGYIGKQSPHYNEFYKFIKNISFGDRPKYLSYGYLFDEVQDHHFFDLYSIHLCD